MSVELWKWLSGPVAKWPTGQQPVLRPLRHFVTLPLTGVLGCALLLVTGCIHRSLTIRTQPPGASVYVNDTLKGQSPVTCDFLWYGWHRVKIEKEGYDRLNDHTMLHCPFYLWIPLDVIIELLPLTVHDDRTLSYTLTPAQELPTPVPPTEPGTPAASFGEAKRAGVGEGNPEAKGRGTQTEPQESGDAPR